MDHIQANCTANVGNKRREFQVIAAKNRVSFDGGGFEEKTFITSINSTNFIIASFNDGLNFSFLFASLKGDIWRNFSTYIS